MWTQIYFIGNNYNSEDIIRKKLEMSENIHYMKKIMINYERSISAIHKNPFEFYFFFYYPAGTLIYRNRT